MTCYLFGKEDGSETVVFTDEDVEDPAAEYALPGYTLSGTAEDVHFDRTPPGEGDAFEKRR